jgi:branched-chain amino acid transport system permease protein
MTRGPLGLANILPPRIGKFEFDTPFKQYFLILSIATFSAFIIYRLMHSEIGLAITALKNDEKAAAAMGIKPHKYRLLAFLLSSLIAGVGGAFYAQYIGFIDPNSFSFEQSLQILSMTIIGGLNSIAGSFLGAFFLTALPEVLRPLISIRFVIYGALLVVMIMVRPQGILGGFNLEHIRQRVLAEKGKK